MQSAKVVAYAAAEILSRTTSGNLEGSSPLIDPAISSTICFVSFFEPIELIVSACIFARCHNTQASIIVFMHYIRVLIELPCPRMTCYYVILEKCCSW